MVVQKQILPGFAVALCIARTLAERDPGFLKALRTNVLEMQGLQPPGQATWETLSIFLAAFEDRRIFPNQ
jgi:hypothetical protein